MLTLMPILAPLRTCWLLFQLVLTRALRVWESRVLAALSLFTPRPALAQGVPSDVSCSVHGAATAWPPTSYMPQDFEDYVSKNYDVSRPGIAKLLEQNRRTGIDQRAVFAPFSQPRWQDRSNPPTIADTDKLFRTEGVALAVRASRAALAEWAGRTSDITHVVMVTCTAAGSPGFDLAVCQALDLPLTVDRTLLHGVGCAGGMSIVRSASKIADAATLRGEKANILVCACELASTTVHLELERAEREADVSPGAVIFADGAAAMVLCNGAASAAAESEPLYGLMACTAQLIPDSSDLMSFLPGPGGFNLHLTRAVPTFAAQGLLPAFLRLVQCLPAHVPVSPAAFDWALHPGGKAVIAGVEKAVGLGDGQLRATKDIYRTRGNSSSVAVLAVMDRLRGKDMGAGREHVLSCSFGPGLTVEMGVWRRGG